MYKTSGRVKNFYIKVELQEAFAFPKKKWAIEREKIILFVLYKSKRNESILSKTKSVNSSHSLHLECSTSPNVLIHLH